MLIVDKQKNIKLSRGDYAEICFNLRNKDGSEYKLSSGQKVKFAVKFNPNNEQELIKKTITNDGESFVVVTLEKSDTENLTFGRYFYDIRIIDANGKINTPMMKANFEVLEVISNGD